MSPKESDPRNPPRIEDYHDAVRFVESLIRSSPRPRNRREDPLPIDTLLRRLGNPERAFPAIHITGSKGKGSTALFTEALLEAAGLRCGSFTSPHLEQWRERIRLGRDSISGEGFAKAVEDIRPSIACLQRQSALDGAKDTAPAFFDALVAAAFCAFARAGVDMAVIETGIGARLDPTSACIPVATCITGIELEHAERIGPTLRDIAADKAAIIRPQTPHILGPLAPELLAIVEAEALRKDAPMIRSSIDFSVENHPDTAPHENSFIVRIAKRKIPIRLRHPGKAMQENAASSIALTAAAGALDRLDDRAIGEALGNTLLPGRMEVLRKHPLFIVDGAHTRISIEKLIATIDSLLPTQDKALIALLGLNRAKDVSKVLSPMVERAGLVITTTAEATRSYAAGELAGILSRLHPDTEILPIPDPDAAIAKALDAAADKEKTICATGSMYLAGAARKAMRKIASSPKPLEEIG
ncbi:MAG: hypothetical protein ISN28_08770 [Ectothiorhodospiraceae bacterium AqS1]|nr:hypothetical protein [Ectothiorhodospiraceae bacterium AqS1]